MPYMKNWFWPRLFHFFLVLKSHWTSFFQKSKIPLHHDTFIFRSHPHSMGGRNEMFLFFFSLVFWKVGYRIFNYIFHSLSVLWPTWEGNKLLIYFIHPISFLIAFIIYSNKPNTSPEIRKVIRLAFAISR